MDKLFFVPATRINARIQETVMSGYHIEIDGYTYEQVSRRPLGRSIARKLINTKTNEKFIIYN